MLAQKNQVNQKNPASSQANQQPKKNNTVINLLKRFWEWLLSLLFGKSKPPETAQQSIPYEQMYKDGICRVNSRYYNKTVVFNDINYQLARGEVQIQIFENYCKFLNYYDNSVSVQLSFINQYGNINDFKQSVNIAEQNDSHNRIRREFSEMLKNQLAKGNNGLIKTKYVTFGIEANSLNEAKQRLGRMETDIIANFKAIGVPAYALTGAERLEILYKQLNSDTNSRFHFDWDDMVLGGMSTKDYIAPTSFDFSDSKTFKTGGTIGAVSYMQITATELDDRILVDLLDGDSEITVTLHIRSLEQVSAIKTIKHKLSDIDKMVIEEQKKAFKGGYGMDIIPSDLKVYGEEAEKLLTDLQSRNERMFLVTFLVMNTAKTKQKLDSAVFAASGIAQKNNCTLKRLDYQQEQGLMSSLPIGFNQIKVNRTLTTSSTAAFMPFTTQELFMHSPSSLYYGLNALSNNMIMADRKQLKNPNGLYLGTPGSGKSFAAKREILNVFLTTADDIIVSDPESEYSALVERLDGQVIRLSPSSSQYINPMDITENYSDGDDPVRLKSSFILSLCELITSGSGKSSLSGEEISVIDRSLKKIYDKYFADPKPENMPVLGDLYDMLLSEKDNHHAQRIAASLEIYATGSLNVFNHRTNVDINNRLVCYDIKELGSQLKKIGMLILQDAVWSRVSANRNVKKSTWIYFDEFHLLLKDRQSAEYCVDIWKRFRKYGGLPTAMTQNVKDLLASSEIQNIFDNSDFVLMLNQAGGDRQILAKQFNISDQQLHYVTSSNAGEGLLIYGGAIIPFVDRYPRDTESYKIMSSKMSEIADRK